MEPAINLQRRTYSQKYPRLAIKKYKPSIKEKVNLYKEKINSPYLEEIADILTGQYRDEKRGRIWDWISRINYFNEKFEELSLDLKEKNKKGKISAKEANRTLRRAKALFNKTTKGNKYFKNNYNSLNLTEKPIQKLEDLKYKVIENIPLEECAKEKIYETPKLSMYYGHFGRISNRKYNKKLKKARKGILVDYIPKEDHSLTEKAGYYLKESALNICKKIKRGIEKVIFVEIPEIDLMKVWNSKSMNEKFS